MQEQANEYLTEPRQRRWRWYLADVLLHRTNGNQLSTLLHTPDLGRLQLPRYSLSKNQ